MNAQTIRRIILSQMEMTGIGRQELAAAARMSERTLRTKLKDPYKFTLQELGLIGRKIHIDITIERRES